MTTEQLKVRGRGVVTSITIAKHVNNERLQENAGATEG